MLATWKQRDAYMNNKSSTRSWFAMAVALQFLVGCATPTLFSAPFPASTRTPIVEVVEDHPPSLGHPIGAFYSEASRTYFTGHQRGTGGYLAISLFATVVSHYANRAEGEAAFRRLLGEMDAGLANETRVNMTKKVNGDVSVTANRAKLTLRPTGIVSQQEDGSLSVLVELRARQLDSNGTQVWSGNYFAPGTDSPLPPSSDITQTRELVKRALHVGIDRATTVVSEQLRGNLVGETKITVTGRWPWIGDDGTVLEARVLGTVGSHTVLQLVSGGKQLYSGTHLVAPETFRTVAR